MLQRGRIGRVEVIAVEDCAPPPADPAWSFPDVPASAWAPHRQYALDAAGKFRASFGVFVLRSPDAVVVVDTGIGPGPHPQFGNVAGNLLAELEAAGVALREVGAVVLTHLHFDHIGWNLDYRGADGPAPAFPNAAYCVSAADWEHWTRSRDPATAHHARAVQRNAAPLERLGVLEKVRGEHIVAPGIRTLPTPGHTPGHQSILVESDGERGIVTGDVFHSPAQVSEPEWCHRADMDRDQARRTRRKVLELAAASGMLVASGHFLPGFKLGRVAVVEGRRYWQGI